MKYSIEELVPIVAKLSERYTSKESTSITYETAEQLMGAVLYCIAEGCRDDSDILAAPLKREISDIKKPDAQAAYQKGCEAVVQKVLCAKALYEEIMVDFRSYGNQCYKETVQQGMPVFFVHYDAQFCPQDTILTLDYPTLCHLEGMCGVDAIYQYLTYIQLEQKFLAGFSEAYVEAALTNFHGNHEELFINVAGVVVRDAVEQLIEGEKTEERLMAALVLLVNKRYEGNQELLAYLQREIADYAAAIRAGASN